MLAPGALYFIRRRKSANHVSRLLRTALPCTVIVALWFITCFGTMNEQIRTKLGAESVNVTIATFTQIDNAQLPVLLVAPFLKVPALLCIISCCLSGKTIDSVFSRTNFLCKTIQCRPRRRNAPNVTHGTHFRGLCLVHVHSTVLEMVHAVHHQLFFTVVGPTPLISMSLY
jgi:hypothetical protein